MKMMWNLIRVYKNSRILITWKLLGYYGFRRSALISPKYWGWGPKRFVSPEDTRPCMICRRQMESACNEGDWSTDQPWGGGAVKFVFHYGSCKFDTLMSGTFYTGYICDDCAEVCMDRGEMTNAD